MGVVVSGLFDDFTPREVWLEYEARKRAIACATVRSDDHNRLVSALVDELGLGINPDSLTAAQRAAQERAIEAWGAACGK